MVFYKINENLIIKTSTIIRLHKTEDNNNYLYTTDAHPLDLTDEEFEKLKNYLLTVNVLKDF